MTEEMLVTFGKDGTLNVSSNLESGPNLRIITRHSTQAEVLAHLYQNYVPKSLSYRRFAELADEVRSSDLPVGKISPQVMITASHHLVIETCLGITPEYSSVEEMSDALVWMMIYKIVTNEESRMLKLQAIELLAQLSPKKGNSIRRLVQIIMPS